MYVHIYMLNKEEQENKADIVCIHICTKCACVVRRHGFIRRKKFKTNFNKKKQKDQMNNEQRAKLKRNKNQKKYIQRITKKQKKQKTITRICQSWKGCADPRDFS